MEWLERKGPRYEGKFYPAGTEPELKPGESMVTINPNCENPIGAYIFRWVED